MKLIALALTLMTSPLAFANSPFDAAVGACLEDYKAELIEAKKDFVSSSVWNYDNDYEVDQVAVSEAYDVTAQGEFKVDLSFDVEGLEDQSSTYIFTPFFTDSSKATCDYIHVDGPIEN